MRVDSAMYSGYVVPPYYDSLIAKLVAHGATRAECIRRLSRALEEYVIGGIDTTIELHRSLLENADVQKGAYDVHWLERTMAARR